LGLTAEKTAVVTAIAPSTRAEAREAVPEVPAASPIVEIRLDALREEADLALFRTAFAGKKLIATLRSTEQGGRFAGDPRPMLEKALDAGFDYVDVEAPWNLAGLDPARVVASHHDLAAIPTELDRLYDEMSRSGARFVKIVGTAADSRDAMRLLAFQRRRNDGRLAAFAMGQAGMATRVLAPYFGASLSYGALRSGSETAPGQITSLDLLEVYGIGRRREVERLFVLFGGRVSHSLSPALHNANFEAGGDTSLYVPFALKSMLTEFDPFVVASDGLGLPLKGASVTIPFKEDAATVALFRGEHVANTLVRSGDTFMASNTDRMAIQSFTPLAFPGMRALVLGAGGTARVAVEVLIARRYDVFIWSRHPVRAHELAEETGATFLGNLRPGEEPFRMLVNATPVGMKADDPLPCPEEYLHGELTVIDAPYGLVETELCRLAKERGARVTDGHALLLAQAAKQAELFTGRPTTGADLAARLPERFRSLFEVTP